MLVLSRNENEDIVITPVDANGNKLEQIFIKLVTAGNGRAKIGIEAPLKYKVNRFEIEQREQANNKPVAVNKERKIAPMENNS